MKKYGHLVTFVGQKYFNLTLPASCLSLNTPLHFYQLQRYIKAPKSEESSLQKGLSPSPNQGHSFNERATAALSTTISNKAMTFFTFWKCI